VLNTDVTNYISQRVKILSIKKEKLFGSLSNFKTIEVNIADTFFVYVYRLYNTIIMDWLFSLLGVSWERSMFFSHRARHCFSRKANICIQVYSHFLHTKSVIFLQIFSKISCWILSIARQIILGFFSYKIWRVKISPISGSDMQHILSHVNCCGVLNEHNIVLCYSIHSY
jgi:hypothetical protein